MTATMPRPQDVHRERRSGVVPALVAAIVILSLVVAGLAVALARQPTTSGLQGSGVAATQVRPVPAFTAVDLAGSNQVTVNVGPAQRVSVTADDNLLRYVTTEVRAGTLVIGDRGSYSARSPMRVDVTVPSLGSVTISGSGIITVSGVSATDFSARLLGSGVLTVAGSAAHVEASVTGSGDLRLQGLVANAATAVVSGSGRITVYAKSSLTATVSGSGVIQYGGHPVAVTKNVTGSGAIVAGDSS
jgi:Putative auto-transporter adhesin, head GIN domain